MVIFSNIYDNNVGKQFGMETIITKETSFYKLVQTITG